MSALRILIVILSTACFFYNFLENNSTQALIRFRTKVAYAHAFRDGFYRGLEGKDAVVLYRAVHHPASGHGRGYTTYVGSPLYSHQVGDVGTGYGVPVKAISTKSESSPIIKGGYSGGGYNDVDPNVYDYGGVVPAATETGLSLNEVGKTNEIPI